MSAAPVNSNSDMVTMYVLINGNGIPDSVSVLSASVQLGLEKGNTATVVIIANGIMGEDPVFTSPEGKIPAGAIVGDAVEIRMGYENNNSTVFKGTINSITAKTTDTAGLLYYLKCRGPVPEYKGGDIAAVYGENIIHFDFETEKGGAVTGNLTVQGTNLPFPGDKVFVGGVWADEQKELPIVAVNHEMADGNWRTTVFIEKNK